MLKNIYKIETITVDYINDLKNSQDVYDLLLETNVNLENLGKLLLNDFNYDSKIKTLIDVLKMEQCMKLFELLNIEQLDELVNKYTKI
jgi:hypothetical protein